MTPTLSVPPPARTAVADALRATPRPAPAPPAPPLAREALWMLAWYALSAVLLCWIFPAYAVWPLAFVCLAPWAVATLRTSRAWLAHWLSFLVGSAFFLVALRWLMPVTGLGYVALALYLGVYWTLAGWAIRTAHRHGVSPIWSLPVAWVACEFLRANVMTGFPWLFLAHSLYAQLPLIQIADLFGAYGVSFLVAMINGVIVEACLRRWPAGVAAPHPRQLIVGSIVTVLLLVATLAYGIARMGQVDFEGDPSLRGPRVAVIQGDFPNYSDPNRGAAIHEIVATYVTLAAQAAAAAPDLIAFPETVWPAYQNWEFVERERVAVEGVSAGMWGWSKLSHDALSNLARGNYRAVNAFIDDIEERMRDRSRADAVIPRVLAASGPPVNLLVGSVAIEIFPEATYPRFKRFNSALLYDREGVQDRKRYDKIHLVPFGEIVPFRQATFLGIDLHYWLYKPLNALSPFSDQGRVEYSLWPGEHYHVFQVSAGQRTYRFGTPICYESTTPYIVRNFVWAGRQRRVDFLVNISNDGWFLHSHELPQHLAINVLRAVENRIGIARAVNTGISGFIDPNGRIYSRVVDDQGRSFRYGVGGIVGYDIQPVYIDRRASFYGATGDWFAAACALIGALLWLSAIFERWILAIQHRINALLQRARPTA